MFCVQCEQTDRAAAIPGCASARGTCGKDATTADLQDLLIHQVKGIAQYAVRARALGVADARASAFVLYAMFTTLTNVNFNATRFTQLIDEAATVRDRLRQRYQQAAAEAGVEVAAPTGPARFTPAADVDGMLEQARAVGIRAGVEQVGEEVVGLRALVLYGLKGVCAYAHHAHVLGHDSSEASQQIEETLAYLATDPTDPQELLERALQVGRTNLVVLRLLDTANTSTFGTPRPAPVATGPVPGKAILVSGHDLRDLATILERTRDTGINVYTHGEMLPAHGYPALAAHPHLVGNYGGAWQDQQAEFARFPGPIVVTSNCLIEPLPAYRHRIFTTGPVGWPGVRHLTDDLTPLIQAARAMPGFPVDGAGRPAPRLTVGYGGDAVLESAGEIVRAVREGQLRHLFLIGGCDGAAPGRNYYTEFAEQAPEDTVVLTLGCAKYRFNRHEFGAIGAIPRLLDVGQCNDSYSAIRIASALAEAFDCGINDLPLSLVLSWFEQKAAAVLLTLLALGVTNIRLGPTLPAFLTPEALQTLVERFGLTPVGDPTADLTAALTGAGR